MFPLALGTLVIATALIGLANAIYFIGVTHRLFAPDASWIPRVSRMSEDTCARIVDTPYARVFGLSNAAYGAAWYLIVAGLGTRLILGGTLPFCGLLIVLAAGTVLFSVYLAWALIQRLEVRCPLCFLGHGLNTLILVELLIACAST